MNGALGRDLEKTLRARPIVAASFTATGLGLCALAVNETVLRLKLHRGPRWALWVAAVFILYLLISEVILLPLAARRDSAIPIVFAGFATASAATIVGVVAAVMGESRWVIAGGYVASLVMLGTAALRQRRKAFTPE